MALVASDWIGFESYLFVIMIMPDRDQGGCCDKALLQLASKCPLYVRPVLLACNGQRPDCMHMHVQICYTHNCQ